MTITITGGTPWLTAICKDFIELLSVHMGFNEELDPVQVSLVDEFTAFRGTNGYIQKLDGSWFIEVDVSMMHKYMLVSLAHQLVHIKQVSVGRLEISSTNHLIWDGEVTAIKCGSYMEFALSPWNVEAREMEDDLFNWWAENSSLAGDWTKTT